MLLQYDIYYTTRPVERCAGVFLESGFVPWFQIWAQLAIYYPDNFKCGGCQQPPLKSSGYALRDKSRYDNAVVGLLTDFKNRRPVEIE